MKPFQRPFLPARWRAWGAYAAPLLLGASALAGTKPRPTHPRGTLATRSALQGSVMGRYVLRSVNAQPLPVVLAGDDPQHTLQVTDGLLQLNPDGSYLCRTVATDVNTGLQETFADTLIGGYTILTPNTIELDHKGLKPDTITTSGFQIAWAHPVRTFQGLFLYSK
jgi:hypothetical protein